MLPPTIAQTPVSTGRRYAWVSRTMLLYNINQAASILRTPHMARPRSSNPKSVLLALRITPRMRYGLELLARQRGASMSEVVSDAIERALGGRTATLRAIPQGEHHPVAVLDRVWSPVEHERVVRLAFAFPEMLDEREEELWGQLRRLPAVWKRGANRQRLTIDDVDWVALARNSARIQAAGHQLRRP